MYRDYEYLEAYWGIFLIFFLIVLGVSLLFYLAQYNLLNAIEPQNRLLQPGFVFLQFIPLFGTIYSFIVVTKIADSIRLEAEGRLQIGEGDLLEKPPLVLDESRPTYGIGIAWCVLGVCYILPYLGNICAIASFVCWIVYWSKITAMRQLVMAT